MLRELRRIRFERDRRSPTFIPIKSLCRIAGVEFPSLQSAMVAGRISPAICAKLSWIIDGVKAGKFHFAIVPMTREAWGVGATHSGYHLCEGQRSVTVPHYRRYRIKKNVVDVQVS